MESRKQRQLRRLVKTGLAHALHWSQVDAWIGYLLERRKMPMVIGYHRVVEDFAAEARWTIPAMLISLQMLERQLDWLGRRFRFVSLDDVGSRLEQGEAFDPPAVAVTFDDGYQDVYEHAFPLLKRKGIPAAVFVVTDLVGTSRIQLFDKLYLLLQRTYAARDASGRSHLVAALRSLGIRVPSAVREASATRDPFLAVRALLERLSQEELGRVIEVLEGVARIEPEALMGLAPLTWSSLAEMQRHGITIGSHTKTHALLTNESRSRLLEETAGSRQELERRLGIPIQHFAYPDGRFDPAAVSSVAASGYRYAYTTCRHQDPRYPLMTIPRMVLWQDSCLDAVGRFSSSILSCQMQGIFNGHCAQSHGSPRWPRPVVPRESRLPEAVPESRQVRVR